MAGLEAFGIVGYECERNCRPSAESNSFGLCRDARLLQIESLKYNKMKRIVGNEFGGERPLFASCDLCLEDVTVHAGESALKECRNIEAVGCRFEGKYPFWHNDGFVIRKCLFTEGARAALWYSRDLRMSDTRVEAPKMFREMDGVRLENVQIPNAQETLWHCRDAEIHSKDAFWNSEDVTVYDSVLDGEYLGWHSKRLKLVNCRISGTQPLCYAQDLVMENCTMDDDCDLAFEYSTLRADIKGCVRSVKNPRSGSITAGGYGEIILDAHVKAPADCEIRVGGERNCFSA